MMLSTVTSLATFSKGFWFKAGKADTPGQGFTLKTEG
jgi:hypothetical protein